MVGTAKYLAPEQVSGGEIDARTDVYAVGAVLYEMLCGRAPFAGDNDLAVATARLHGPPPRPRTVLRTVPPRLDDDRHEGPRHRPRTIATRRASALWADLQSCPIDDQPLAPVVATDVTTVEAQPVLRPVRALVARARAARRLVAVALGLAWVLIGGSEAGRDLFDLVGRVDARPGNPWRPIAPVDLGSPPASFDPQGVRRRARRGGRLRHRRRPRHGLDHRDLQVARGLPRV